MTAPEEFEYTERDVILYNLGVGATEKELQWTYEGHDNFSALPTFGVIPQFASSSGIPLDWLPNFNPVCTFLLYSDCVVQLGEQRFPDNFVVIADDETHD